VLRQRLDVHVEPLLHLVQHLAVLRPAHKSDGQAFGAKAPSTTHTMEVGVCTVTVFFISLWHVVIDDNVDALHIDATAYEVGGNKDALLAFLELFVYLQQVVFDFLPKEGGGRERMEKLGDRYYYYFL
jgi:hypothetical protein